MIPISQILDDLKDYDEKTLIKELQKLAAENKIMITEDQKNIYRIN